MLNSEQQRSVGMVGFFEEKAQL